MVNVPEGVEHLVEVLESVGIAGSGALGVPLPCAWISPAGLTPINLCGDFTMRADVFLMAKCIDDAHCELSPLLTQALTVVSPIAEIELDAVVNHPIAGQVPAYRIPVEISLSEDC